MIRAVRRTLRGWKRELLSFYGRFNTFRRIVVGIVLAMGLVYSARRFLLNPEQKDIRDVESRLKNDSVPDVVPRIDTDKETQDSLLRAETREKQLVEFQERLAAAERQSRFSLDASVSDANEALNALAIDCGLRVNKKAGVAAAPPAAETEKAPAKGAGKKSGVPEPEPAEPADAIPANAAANDYELRGDFASIKKFLQRADELPFLARIEKIAFGAVPDENNEPVMLPGGRLLLSLSFRFLVFRYEKVADDGRNRS